MKWTAPRGTRDILPGEIEQWQWVERVFAQTCALFDFHEIRIPTFEATEVFTRGVGDSSDIVRKEMYTFLDKSERSMTLRPEGTAGVARAFVQGGLHSWTFPVRLFYNLNLFRYERVAKGRYREFHQLGVEAFGSNRPEMDVEVISLLVHFLKALGLKEWSLKINSIGHFATRKRYNEALMAYLQPHLETLCPDCRERYLNNPMRILDCKVDHCQALVAEAPRLIDFLTPDETAHFQAVQQGLMDLDIPFAIDPNIVRGLDYYTDTVFEFVSDHVGTQGTLCGGGRYDHLIEEMGGQPLPGVGFALGLERLLMELQAQGCLGPQTQPVQLFVATLDEAAQRMAAKLVHQARQRGISAQTELTGRSLKAQMKYANRLGAEQVLVLGETELKSGQGALKRMQTGESVQVVWQSDAGVIDPSFWLNFTANPS